MFAFVYFVSCSFILTARSSEILDSLKDEMLYPDNYQNEFVRPCFGELGCFYTGPPFYNSKYRPVTVPPENNTVTKFYLFTPENPDTKYELEADEDSLRNSKFDDTLPLKVLIHGYLSKELSEFYDLRDEFLKHSKYNVIVVDWTLNNNPPLWQAIANLRLNAARLSRLLNFLMKKTSLKPNNIHIIGHSLGAHLAGLVGEQVKNIGRITGLDPAGSYFQKAPRAIRLDSTDANFVEVIHTNSGNDHTQGMGLFQPIGHINFYPNGGNLQPGCSSEARDSKEMKPDSCSHSRSVELYTASINLSDCKFLATQCRSWNLFKRGYCQPWSYRVKEMGFNAQESRKTSSQYFLRTSDKKPFCLKNGNSPES